jgi:hypothetical protein
MIINSQGWRAAYETSLNLDIECAIHPVPLL